MRCCCVQLEFSSERYKVLNANTDSHRQEIEALRDKSQRMSELVVKHQQTIALLREVITRVRGRSRRWLVHDTEGRRPTVTSIAVVETSLSLSSFYIPFSVLAQVGHFPHDLSPSSVSVLR